ncbi:hypothetical protein F5Y15DRAFT_139619 [Xylariaceae sp. FL0016]|nr:hypothetical protein F5Y15DRAFT_139619 [Xylariaceae sp. FL0016]
MRHPQTTPPIMSCTTVTTTVNHSAANGGTPAIPGTPPTPKPILKYTSQFEILSCDEQDSDNSGSHGYSVSSSPRRKSSHKSRSPRFAAVEAVDLETGLEHPKSETPGDEWRAGVEARRGMNLFMLLKARDQAAEGQDEGEKNACKEIVIWKRDDENEDEDEESDAESNEEWETSSESEYESDEDEVRDGDCELNIVFEDDEDELEEDEDDDGDSGDEDPIINDKPKHQPLSVPKSGSPRIGTQVTAAGADEDDES